MASTIDTTKAQRALERAAQDEATRRIGAAAFRKPFTDGLRNIVQSANFPPNSPRWLAKKQAKGWGNKPWLRTGKTLDAISDNPPVDRLKTQGRVRFGLNRKAAMAFAQPRAFTDGRGRRFLRADDQEKVLNVHQRGSEMQRMREGAAKKGVSVAEYLEDASLGSATGKIVPARPLMRWVSEWFKAIERDVEKAIATNLKKEGFIVRR